MTASGDRASGAPGQKVVLAVDEGTTGTRAGRVYADGSVSAVEYRRIHVQHHGQGIVEQDADEIWSETLAVVAAAVSKATQNGETITSLGICNQRATAILWDRVTGHALCPAMVWQDTRYADELGRRSASWDARLIPRTGRPAGVRSPYLWAARKIQAHAGVAEAYRAGRLLFGTVDSWLVWKLTGGERHILSATNATACGGYLLKDFRYFGEWIDELSFPRDLLPELVDDGADIGWTREDIIGVRVPIRSVMGDQHAGLLGLGCVATGDSMVVHGTGSFVDQVIGTDLPPNAGRHDATATLTAWRTGGESVFSVETFTPSTGAFLDGFCDGFGLFESVKEMSAEAATVPDSGTVVAIPAPAGVRLPVVASGVFTSLSGLSGSTTRAHIAHALIEGPVHFVAACLEANSDVSGLPIGRILVGGGLAQSDVLMQKQADLTGLPLWRSAHADTASLRGAAFMAGAGVIWDSLEAAAATLPPGTRFEPQMSDDERLSRRRTWRERLDAEIELSGRK